MTHLKSAGDFYSQKLNEDFNKLASIVINLISSLGDEVEKQIESEVFKDLNSKLIKIHQAENVLDFVEGVSLNKKIF